MLKLFALPASSLIVKLPPAENADAPGNLMSIAADAETPMILSVADEVTEAVTNVLENTADDSVTVTSLPSFEATTAAPTKSILLAAVVMFEPSSLILMSVPPPPD